MSHSGASAVGEFVHTDCVDIATCWVERKAVMGKSALGVLNAVTEIEHQLPFPLKGIDSDNGSEFINNLSTTPSWPHHSVHPLASLQKR